MAKHRFNPEEHWKQVNNAVSNMKFVKEEEKRRHDPINKLMHDLAEVITDVHALVRPTLKAGGGFDEPALKELVFKSCLDKVVRFSKDELQILICIVIADAVMDDIKSSPSGGDNPDLLAWQ